MNTGILMEKRFAREDTIKDIKCDLGWKGETGLFSLHNVRCIKILYKQT